MGSLSPWHWAILAVVVILLFGAKKLPDAARSLGKSMRIFKSEMREMQTEGKPEAPSIATLRRGASARAVAAGRPAGGYRAGSHRGAPGLARHRRRGARAPLTERRERIQNFSPHRCRAEAAQPAQSA